MSRSAEYWGQLEATEKIKSVYKPCRSPDKEGSVLRAKATFVSGPTPPRTPDLKSWNHGNFNKFSLRLHSSHDHQVFLQYFDDLITWYLFALLIVTVKEAVSVTADDALIHVANGPYFCLCISLYCKLYNITIFFLNRDINCGRGWKCWVLETSTHRLVRSLKTSKPRLVFNLCVRRF